MIFLPSGVHTKTKPKTNQKTNPNPNPNPNPKPKPKPKKKSLGLGSGLVLAECVLRWAKISLAHFSGRTRSCLVSFFSGY